MKHNFNSYALQVVPTTPLCSGLSMRCIEVTVEVDTRIMELCVLQPPQRNTRQVWGREGDVEGLDPHLWIAVYALLSNTAQYQARHPPGRGIQRIT